MNKKLFIILFIALAVRLIYLFQIKDHFLFQQPILDAKYYHEWALEIAGTDWLGKTRGVFMMSPGYSYFLAAIYKLAGPNIKIVVMLQFVLGIITGLLIFLIGKKYFQNKSVAINNSLLSNCSTGKDCKPLPLHSSPFTQVKERSELKLAETAGLLAMTLFLFYSPEIFYESTLLKSTLINFINVLALYLIICGGGWRLIVSGILFGYSVHLRPNILVFVPVVCIYLYLSELNKTQPAQTGLDKISKALPIFTNKKALEIGLKNIKPGNMSAKAIRNISLYLIGFMVILAPVAVRNYVIGKQFVISTAHGGMNFFTGNSAYCKGPYTPMPFARTDPEVEQQDFLNEAQRLTGKKLTGKESSEFWYKQSFKYISANPADWAALMAKKTLIFFNEYEPAINLDYYFFKSQYKSILSLPLATYGLILPLAIIGLFSVQADLLFLGYLLTYLFMNIIFFVVSEYRFPVVPVLCLYAGFGIIKMLDLLKQPGIRKYGVIALAVCLFAAVKYDIYTGIFGFNNYKRANLANSYFGLGVTYEDKSMIEKAVETYRQAIEIMPQTAPMINLANIYESRGMLNDAEQIYKKTLSMVPSAEAYNNLGSVLYKKGDFVNSYNCFKRAVELNPGLLEARNNMEVTEREINGKHTYHR